MAPTSWPHQFDDQMGPPRPNIAQQVQRGTHYAKKWGSDVQRWVNLQIYSRNRGIAGAAGSYLRSGTHRAGMGGARSFLGIGHNGRPGSKLMKGLLAVEMYQGYQRGGVGGAISAGVHQAVTGYAFDAVMHATGAGKIALAGLGAATLAGAVSYATGGTNPLEFLARPYVKDHMKRHSQLEMGRPSVDEFGTLATMRQRSLAAIQNSRINGRSALGNEGQISYRPYFR